jgi:hypothetical protein
VCLDPKRFNLFGSQSLSSAHKNKSRRDLVAAAFILAVLQELFLKIFWNGDFEMTIC